ncbi:MAG: radical SAM protein, partial [Candidatus Scalindua sp.]|nr:radical SAM protein [Candidatus Scalindua sp.]
GTSCEIITKKALLGLNKEELTVAQRAAGTLYFHQNESKYKVNKFKHPNPKPHYNVCLETEKDLKLLELIFKILKNPYTDQIIELLDSNPALVEINKYDSANEVGLEKLCLFPEKIAAVKDINFFKPDNLYPISVELSLTNGCNLDCVWCSDRDLRARQAGEMDFDVLKKLLLDLKQGGTKGIVIEGGGEPTIYKYFNEVVEFIHDLGLNLGMITNGNIRLRTSIMNKFDWIRISLDASNIEEYKKLKGQDCFEEIMSNIEELCNSNVTIGIGFVVTSGNVGSLESLILRLSAFGVRYIQFRPVIDHPELELEIDLTYLKRYEHEGFTIYIDGMHENLVEGNANLPCKAHSLTTVITADGSVYLCGRLNIHPWVEPIGNVNNESFRDIWFGKRRMRQSNMVLDHEFCKKYCPKCRLTKYNQLFNRIEKIKTRNFI